VRTQLGDSRCLVIDQLGHLKFSTKDHKPTDPEEHARIVQSGGFVQFGRVNGFLALSRAIGDAAFKTASLLPAQKQAVISTSTMMQIQLDEHDVVLVACDGIFERMSNEEVAMYIHDQLRREPLGNSNPSVAASNLLAHSLERGSKDNMSCILWVPVKPTQTAVNFPIDTKVFVPGTFEDRLHSATFVEAYRRDLLRHQYNYPAFDKACSRVAQDAGYYSDMKLNTRSSREKKSESCVIC